MTLSKYKKFQLNNPWINSYTNARQRCMDKNCKDYPHYGGRGILFKITREQVKELWFRDKAYEMKKPSINREDNDGNYEFDNCEFIEMGKNSAERNTRVSKPVLQYDLDGNFIKEWISATEVQRQLGIEQGNISKMCQGKINWKSCGGFIWRFKDVKR
jgi:hypothetical protein